MDLASVLEEAAFAHVGHKAEFIVARALTGLFLGWNLVFVSSVQVQYLVDKVSSRREHCFAGQRACFEGGEIVVKYVHDVVNDFLGEAYTTAAGRRGYLEEVNSMLRSLHGPDNRPNSSVEVVEPVALANFVSSPKGVHNAGLRTELDDR